MSASPTPTVAHPLTLSAPTVAHPLTLSLTNPVPRLCQSPSPPSHRYPRQKNRDVWNGHHRDLKSFSLRSLWKPKKKKGESLYAKCKVCFTVCMLRNSGKNQRICCESLFFYFFYFGFCFEFLIELLKKIEALLFFEFGLCFRVCLGFRVLSFGFRWLSA